MRSIKSRRKDDDQLPASRGYSSGTRLYLSAAVPGMNVWTARTGSVDSRGTVDQNPLQEGRPMNRTFASLVLVDTIALLVPLSATATTPETVTVGNPGNAPDSTGLATSPTGIASVSTR